LRGIETIGRVGVAAQTAPTLEVAFDIFSTFIRAHSPGLQVRLSQRDDLETYFFEFRIILNPAPRQRQATELSLGASLQILRAILGTTYSPLSVHFPHSALSPPQAYVRYFGCTPYFAQPAAGFTLRAADLQRRLNHDDQAHLTAVNELASLVDGAGPPLPQTVTDIARTLLPTGMATIDVVARNLGLHPRALQRRLATENTTFATLLDNLRRETAQRFLRDTDINLDHIGRLIGYSEQSVLTRSCHRWFGSSPTAYREAHA
jgi:AraC-like DNA-binding protein